MGVSLRVRLYAIFSGFFCQKDAASILNTRGSVQQVEKTSLESKSRTQSSVSIKYLSDPIGTLKQGGAKKLDPINKTLRNPTERIDDDKKQKE